MRKKYKEELSDKYNKKKMPHFFSHISRQKGYYNPEKKNYCKYHTSMDYLQTVVNGFKIKNPYKKKWLPFVSILDNNLFRTSGVNQKQINKIYSREKKYICIWTWQRWQVCKISAFIHQFNFWYRKRSIGIFNSI